jgi:S-adenosylmethionine hydrolase
MKIKRNRTLIYEHEILREVLWKEKYIESGENVMIPSYAFIFEPGKKKHKIDQLDEFGNLIEDWPEDEFIDKEY